MRILKYLSTIFLIIFSFLYQSEYLNASTNKPTVINMTEKSIGYAPQYFTVNRGVPVEWKIYAQRNHGCRGNLVLAKLGINKRLKIGSNIINFTPTKAGTYNFTCSAGKGRGSIKVVEPQIIATQTINATFTNNNDIQPSDFTVKVNQPVRFEIDVKETNEGCMSYIMIPYLFEKPQPLIAGNKIVMEFTPTQTGLYEITCPMGIPRGTVFVTK